MMIIKYFLDQWQCEDVAMIESDAHDNADIVSGDTEEVVRPAHSIIDHLTDIITDIQCREMSVSIMFTLITGIRRHPSLRELQSDIKTPSLVTIEA